MTAPSAGRRDCMASLKSVCNQRKAFCDAEDKIAGSKTFKRHTHSFDKPALPQRGIGPPCMARLPLCIHKTTLRLSLAFQRRRRLGSCHRICEILGGGYERAANASAPMSEPRQSITESNQTSKPDDPLIRRTARVSAWAAACLQDCIWKSTAFDYSREIHSILRRNVFRDESKIIQPSTQPMARAQDRCFMRRSILKIAIRRGIGDRRPAVARPRGELDGL
jgi:hypothetical protein